MITMQEWKVMSGKGRTIWLEENTELSGRYESRRGLVQGVGINDAPYCTKPVVDGKKVVCPAYMAWNNMLTRAYSTKHHAKHPTYSGVTVCDDWHLFMSFREWWLGNYADGFALDKDILSDDGVYSPETCIYVPQWLNTFTIRKGEKQTNAPVGTYFDSGCSRYRADCGNPITGKQEYIGYFKDPEMAHAAWRNRKLELALELKPKMDEIDLRIYPRVIEIINNAK